ncbi:ribonuclease H family protein [Enterococcus hulanensis]|uniref:ribonuclease H n=1 Tax=Enterococcus hulanensis TaxID=2559929 RepID=A0ABU3F1F4_9ENTE|nr:ribonuclease H family protein [Enterococcus hulanensis]MDT2600956.1 ribonuclease H family protein [Enterococcus hulanensis]MDT2611545.1 ribonuclease H family protein [Enterococcus hulanensis]MDT2617971.1 ribonuclease H family protein [Enterococcus hulanensis]MDT2628974.1 ribonuclease H family protein [Enterococcus hulanensis]MDT2656536.1 ribonuclease H family protein [Enterococcus hulanensis]
MEKRFYAVRKGAVPGIYATWNEAKVQVLGFSGASYKKFSTEEEAKRYIDEGSKPSIELNDIECQLYVDGSYSQKNERYGWGFVAVVEGKSIYSKHGSGNNETYLSQWQIGGEVVAVLQALDYGIYKGFEKVEICYDYEGIEKWITGEWRTKSPIAGAYKHYFDLKNEKIDVQFRKVDAHSENFFNELADRLAKKGANENN